MLLSMISRLELLQLFDVEVTIMVHESNCAAHSTATVWSGEKCIAESRVQVRRACFFGKVYGRRVFVHACSAAHTRGNDC